MIDSRLGITYIILSCVVKKGSADYEGAPKYITGLRAHLIELKLLPEEVMKILINIDECGLQWKSLPKRTYAIRGKPIKAKKAMKDSHYPSRCINGWL